MSDQNSYIVAEERGRRLAKCKADCQDKYGFGGGFTGGVQEFMDGFGGDMNEKRLGCELDCELQYTPEAALTGISAEESVTLDTLYEKSTRQNSNAQATAAGKMLPCAQEYLAQQALLSNAYVTFQDELQNALSANIVTSWVGFPPAQKGLPDWQENLGNMASPDVQAHRLSQIETATSKPTPATIVKGEESQSGIQLKTFNAAEKTFNGGLTDQYANLDPIIIPIYVNKALGELGVDDYYAGALSNLNENIVANWSGWPTFWASWVGAFGAQVGAVLKYPVSEGDLLALSSDAPVENSSQSGYHSLTNKILGTQDSQGDSGGGYVNKNHSRGAPVGILNHGAPLYWPGNYSGRNYAVSNPLTSGETGNRNSINMDDSSYSLAAWASMSEELAEKLKSSVNPTAGDPVDIIVNAITKFAGTVKPIALKMAEASECIYNADKDADNLINNNIQKVIDEAKKMGIDGAADWVSGRDRSGQGAAAGDAAAKALRDAANSGRLLYEGTPEKLFFKEQCFLLSFVGILADYKKYYLDHGDKSDAGAPIINSISPEGNHKRLPYAAVQNAAPSGLPHLTNASLLLDGDPYGFLNKLVMSPYARRLSNIENYELSNIQPKIRLFKVIYDDNGGEKEVEISFDSHFSKQDMDFFKTKESRGAGVGLKYFNFTYDGSNPFAAKKSIKAKLEIFANTFQELLRPRKGKVVELKENLNGQSSHFNYQGTEQYKYIELALKTGKPQLNPICKPNQDYLDMFNENEELAKLNFRLKAVVGLSAPTGLSGMKSADAEAIQAALNDSFVTLNLTPTIHDFSFDEQGRVKFTINYLAYVEDFFNQKGFNIFADPTGRVGYNAIVRKLQMKTYQRDCGASAADDNDTTIPDEENENPPTAQEHLAAIKEKFAQQVEKDQLGSIAQLLDSMACANVIYYINVPYDKVKRFLRSGPFADYKSYVQQYKSGNFIRNNASQSQLIANRTKEAMESLSTTRANRDANEAVQADQVKQEIATAIAMVHPQDNNLAYFYASDLLDIIMANVQLELDELPKMLGEALSGTTPIQHTDICEIRAEIKRLNLFKANFRRFRLLLGPVEIVHQKPHESVLSTFVNFGDIPISVKYFTEWLTTKLLARDENHYPLSKFLNDFFNNLIRTFLNNDTCFAYNIAQKVRLNQSVVTSYTGLSNPREDEITHAIQTKLGPQASRINLSTFRMPKSCDTSTGAVTDVIRPEDSDLPILNISGPRGSFDTYAPLSTEMNYFVFFAGRTMPTEEQRGLRCADEDRGIQHYLLGRDKGLIKNIQLSKTEATGLAEVRFEQDGYDGLRQLRNVYDIQIDSFANVQTFPGTYIYVSPSGFDPSVGVDNDGFDLTDMGIGGYCMITRSEHEFGEGYANSTIHAKWVAAVDAQNEENNHNGRSESVQAASGKCGIYAYRHKAHKGGSN